MNLLRTIKKLFLIILLTCFIDCLGNQKQSNIPRLPILEQSTYHSDKSYYYNKQNYRMCENDPICGFFAVVGLSKDLYDSFTNQSVLLNDCSEIQTALNGINGLTKTDNFGRLLINKSKSKGKQEYYYHPFISWSWYYRQCIFN